MQPLSLVSRGAAFQSTRGRGQVRDSEAQPASSETRAVERDERGWPILRSASTEPCDGAHPATGSPCVLDDHAGYHRDVSGDEWLDGANQAWWEHEACRAYHPQTNQPCVLGQHKSYHRDFDGMPWLDDD